jgi:hypothetical protein
MGFLSGAGAAAVLIFGLFAGAWVGRLRRRSILIAADLGRAVVLGIIPLAAMLQRRTNGDLYLVAVASSILTVLLLMSRKTSTAPVIRPAVSRMGAALSSIGH